MAIQRPKKPGTKPPPKCKAILLCDHVIIDAVTGKTSLIGIFAGFFVPKFPGAISPFFAYLQLVDGIGQYDITVEVHDMKDNVAIAKLPPRVVRFQDRQQRAALIFRTAPLPLPHPGQYDFVVLADGQEIDRQTFAATPRSDRPKPKNQGDVDPPALDE